MLVQHIVVGVEVDSHSPGVLAVSSSATHFSRVIAPSVGREDRGPRRCGDVRESTEEALRGPFVAGDGSHRAFSEIDAKGAHINLG